MQQLLLARLEQIGVSLEQSQKAVALIGLGSVGLELERLDEFSDLDFFVIVKDGQKQGFFEDLSWLTNLAAVAYVFQNTADGFKLLFEDDVFCEFAIFEIHELSNIPFAAGRIVWKADDSQDEIPMPSQGSKPPAHSNNLEFVLGECLTNLYIGAKRFARGEKLSAARFVQQYAVDRVLELNQQIEKAQNDFADPFSRERRIEQRYPILNQVLPLFVQGYERTPESALAILVWLETRFKINQAIAKAIRKVIDNV